jgi:hypothetical protein
VRQLQTVANRCKPSQISIQPIDLLGLTFFYSRVGRPAAKLAMDDRRVFPR